MTKHDDGGPAFDGMSLRDWFAGQALASGAVEATAAEAELLRLFPGSRPVAKQELVARRAYIIADAMLQERGAR